MSNLLVVMPSGNDLAVLLTAIGASLALGALAGVFHRRSVVGPERLADNEPVAHIWMLLFFGFFASVLVPSVYGSYKQSQTGSSSTQPVVLSEREIPPVVATAAMASIIALLAGNAIVRPRGLDHLGLSIHRLPRGIVSGAVAVVVVLPLTFVVAVVTKALWDEIGFKHPDAHQLLQVMKDVPETWIQVLSVFSAVVLAPVSEELLYRGHFQTGLLYMMARSRRPSRGFDVVGVPDNEPAQPATTQPAESHGPGSTSRWLAIIGASVVFTALHKELWMMPPIFILSLCLGYLYERTGNLWACILLHSGFNTANVILFWLQNRH